MCSTVDKQGSVYEHRGIVCIEEGLCGKDCSSVVAQDIYPYGGERVPATGALGILKICVELILGTQMLPISVICSP